MRVHGDRPNVETVTAIEQPGAPSREPPAPDTRPFDPRVLAEQVHMLYDRAFIAQATVVVNALLVSWVFWGLAPPALCTAWLTTLVALAAARVVLVRAYRRGATGASDSAAWAHRFAVGAALTGIGWGAAVFIFYAPGSPVHRLFLVFVLGGMTAGAASSNASYTPAFVAFAAPALLPMMVRLGAEGDPIHGAMAFMLALFGVAMAGISRGGNRAVCDAIRLRLRNEALVEGLTAAQERLESLNADLERRVRERTGELERALALRGASEEALRESDRRKSHFIAVLSHELRNPLAPIRNSLYLLGRAAPGSEQAALAREIIERQTSHLTRLVDDLLDVNRISQGKIELRRARVDASELVRRTCDDHRALFRDRGLELRAVTAGAIGIDADETRLTQVIGNLLQNAIKFGRKGGTVTVSVDEAGAEAAIRVRDDGAGIPPDLLPNVFEPFVQAEGGLARSQGGLGLGLALAKGLVELHGGRIAAHSDGAGRGAEFVVNLPLAPPVPRPSPAPLRARPERALRILVIEDNLDEARSIACVLEVEGHRVHVAADGRAGIAKARELEPEVILCDIGLPDVDGYQVARTLRSAERSSARLIALTGYAQPEDRRRAKEAGFDAHIAKPPRMEALLAVLSVGA